MSEPTSRRVFLADGARRAQVLTITQERDGSFYVSCPDFPRSRWVEISENPGPKTVNITTPSGDGKLSIHASGFAGIRAHQAVGHHIKVRGNKLMDAAQKIVSTRHLLSVLPCEPQHVPAGTRVSDYGINGKFKPMAFVLFAVPAISRLEVNIHWGFHIDDIGDPPQLGYGLMTFPFHGVIWLAYSMTGMRQWPPNTYLCHYDGHAVPLFMGCDDGMIRFGAALPTYAFDKDRNQLTIDFKAPGLDDQSDPGSRS